MSVKKCSNPLLMVKSMLVAKTLIKRLMDGIQKKS